MRSRPCRPLHAAAVLGLLAAAPVHAQWVEYTDATTTHLALSTVSATDSEEKDIAVGDLNGDGRQDAVIVRKAPFSNPGPRTDVLLLNRQGSLVERTTVFAPEFISIHTDARDVVIADFTGDGWNDVVIANTFHQQPQFYVNDADDPLGNWLGLSNDSAARFPTLAPPGQNPGPGPLFCAVSAGDVDGDLDLDLFFSNYNPGGGATEDVLLVNDGSGFFTDETSARMGTYARVAFGTGNAILDVNADTHADIVKISTLFSVTPWNALGVFTLFNDGTGKFDTLPFQQVPNTTQEYMFICGQFSQDSLWDMYVVQDSQDRVGTGTGINPDGTLTWSVAQLASSPRTTGFGGNLDIADVDGDGDLDIGIAPVDVDIQNCTGGSAGELALLENDGSGKFSDPWVQDQNFHLRPHDFRFLDVDGDDCPDMLMGLCTGYALFVGMSCAGTSVAASGTEAETGLRIRVEPNPATGDVRLTLSAGLPRHAPLSVSIYDVRGSLVRELWSGAAGSAPERLVWDGRDANGRSVASGAYFARVRTTELEDRAKILMVR